MKFKNADIPFIHYISDILDCKFEGGEIITLVGTAKLNFDA